MLPHAVIFVKAILDVGGFARGDGVFKRVKRANLDAVSIGSYLSAPFVSVRRPMNTIEAGSVAVKKPFVSMIFGASNNPKIFNSVVMPDAIDVINVHGGPLPVFKRPQDAMRLMSRAVDVAALISVAFIKAIKCWFPGNSCVEGSAKRDGAKLAFGGKHIWRSLKPDHAPCGSIVRYDRLEKINRRIKHIVASIVGNVMIIIAPQNSKV